MVAFKHSLSPGGQEELRAVIKRRVERWGRDTGVMSGSRGGVVSFWRTFHTGCVCITPTDEVMLCRRHEKDPISGGSTYYRRNAFTFMQWSDESENNVDHLRFRGALMSIF